MKYTSLVFFLTSAILFSQRADFSTIDFSIADRIAERNKGAGLNNLPVLTHDLTSHFSTDVEKFRAIYTWVSTNIENDYRGYQKTRNKRIQLANDQEAFLAWNSGYAPKMFQKMLKDKQTACSGYAYLIREMAELADIECKIVNGFGRTPNVILTAESPPNHAWNAVKLNDKWYLCDATWSAGRIILEDSGPRFEQRYHDGYFLADPELFIKNHYPLEIDLALLPEPPTFEEFAKGPIVYKEAFTHGSLPLAPSKMHIDALKHEVVLFTFSFFNPAKTDAISMLLKNGNSSEKVRPEIAVHQNKYVLKHTFEKLGLYDVHIQVDEEIVATYVVRVKRK